VQQAARVLDSSVSTRRVHNRAVVFGPDQEGYGGLSVQGATRTNESVISQVSDVTTRLERHIAEQVVNLCLLKLTRVSDDTATLSVSPFFPPSAPRGRRAQEDSGLVFSRSLDYEWTPQDCQGAYDIMATAVRDTTNHAICLQRGSEFDENAGVITDGSADGEEEEARAMLQLSSQRSVTVTCAPVPIPRLDCQNPSAAVGEQVTVDAKYSKDGMGGAFLRHLDYTWTIQSAPASSRYSSGDAAIALTTSTPSYNFEPDVGGMYLVSLVVSDGCSTSEPTTYTIEAACAVDTEELTINLDAADVWALAGESRIRAVVSASDDFNTFATDDDLAVSVRVRATPMTAHPSEARGHASLQELAQAETAAFTVNDFSVQVLGSSTLVDNPTAGDSELGFTAASGGVKALWLYSGPPSAERDERLVSFPSHCGNYTVSLLASGPCSAASYGTPAGEVEWKIANTVVSTYCTPPRSQVATTDLTSTFNWTTLAYPALGVSAVAVTNGNYHWYAMQKDIVGAWQLEPVATGREVSLPLPATFGTVPFMLITENGATAAYANFTVQQQCPDWEGQVSNPTIRLYHQNRAGAWVPVEDAAHVPKGEMLEARVELNRPGHVWEGDSGSQFNFAWTLFDTSIQGEE
jgi:hypothetical protein